MDRVGLAPSDVGLVVAGAPDTATLQQCCASPLEALFDGGTRVLVAKERLGESHGAWGGIAPCAALALQDEVGGWGGRPAAIVHAFGEGTESFYVALGVTRNGESE